VTARSEDEETATLPAVPGIRRHGASPVSCTPPVISSQPVGKAVWIIDDSPTIRAVVTLHLSGMGIAVQPFDNGLDAFFHLRNHPDEAPPLILLDIELPRVDGYKVLQALRALPSCAETAIVMMSARDSVGDRLKSRLAGANTYLIKPVRPDTLLKVTLTYLGVMVPQAPGIPEATRHVS
jgi:two-component system, chemotaxis family, chemotaxis protein CheY